MKQKLDYLSRWSILCLMLTSAGEKADFVVSFISGHCDALVRAHSTRVQVSSAKLTANLWLSTPRKELGKSGENTVLQNTKVRCSQKHQACMSHLSKAVNFNSDGCEHFYTLQA